MMENMAEKTKEAHLATTKKVNPVKA